MDTKKRTLPRFEKTDGLGTLYVDDHPFYIRGGEVRNSSSATAAFMESHVWPYVEPLGLNTLLLPVAWESVEKEKDQFDFSLVGELIAQARKRGMKLILLWMGLWKNAQSTYAPAWVKRDTDTYFRSVTKPKEHMQVSKCSISTFCAAAVDRDANACARLFAYLREQDEDATVITVQIENEVGLLGSERDYHPEATRAFESPVPDTVARHYGVSGTWAEAFGRDACAMFMSWCYASALEKIAAAATREYPLPLYANAWTIQYPGEHPGGYPAGGPVAEHLSMWRLCAPSLCWLSPDIYLPDFIGELSKYDGMPVFVPECEFDLKAASYALYMLGRPNTLGVSPFAIEDMGGGGRNLIVGNMMQEDIAQIAGYDPGAARAYRRANALIQALWDTVYKARKTGDVWSYLERGVIRRAVLSVEAYDCQIINRAHTDGEAPSVCLIVRLAGDEYIVAGMNCTVEWLSPVGECWQAEYLQMDELSYTSGRLETERALNGDEQWIGLGDELRAVRVSLHKIGN